VSPVRGSKRVVDVDVRECREGLREIRIVSLFAGVEAQIFEKQYLPIAELVDRGAGALTRALFAERNARAQQFGEPRRDRSERERRCALSLGSAEM